MSFNTRRFRSFYVLKIQPTTSIKTIIQIRPNANETAILAALGILDLMYSRQYCKDSSL